MAVKDYVLRKYESSSISKHPDSILSALLEQDAIEDIISEIAEINTEESHGLQVCSTEIRQFFDKTFEYARKVLEEAGDSVPDADSTILASRVLHYEFHIHNRSYQSIRTVHQGQVGSEGKILNLIRNSVKRECDLTDKHNPARLISTLVKHLQGCSAELGDLKGKPGDYHIVDDYLKSDLLTWVDHHLEACGDGYDFAAFPYVKTVLIPGNDLIVSVIMTRLDASHVDSKVAKLDRREPVHLLVFQSDRMYGISKEQIRSYEKRIKYIIGYINYSKHCSSKTWNLLRIADDAAAVGHHWYLDGIERVLDESEQELDGLSMSERIVTDILCARVPGAEDLVVFPFDRVYLFPGSNDGAVNNNMMRFKILEASIKSKRPEDRNRWLTTMERLEYNEDAGGVGIQPAIETEFDQTDKRITFQTEIQLRRKELKSGSSSVLTGESSILESSTSCDSFDYSKINFDDYYKDIYGSFTGSGHDELEKAKKQIESNNGYDRSAVEINYNDNLNQLKEHNDDFRLKTIRSGDLYRKIDAVINTLFTGWKFDGKAECQQTYEYYDEDGICFLHDFYYHTNLGSEKTRRVHATDETIFSISSLDTLESLYLNDFFASNSKDLLRIWRNTYVNWPDKALYYDWRNRTESRVVLISFDPEQHEENIDSDGQLYLDNKKGFTILLVVDSDRPKSREDLNSEINSLYLLVKLIIQRQLRDAKLRRESLAHKRLLYDTFIEHVIHRAKGSLPENKQKEMTQLLEKFKLALKADEQVTRQKECESGISVLRYLFAVEAEGGKSVSEVADIEKLLRKQSQEHLKVRYPEKNLGVINGINFLFYEPNVPAISITTNDEFVQEAVKVVLANSIEYGYLYALKNLSDKKPGEFKITVHVTVVPVNEKQGYIELCMVNYAEPIPIERLHALNSNDLDFQLEPDKRKQESTGIGVRMSRIQLRECIGKGADIQYFNLDNSRVMATIVLPITFKNSSVEIPRKIRELSNFKAPYDILIIEDNLEQLKLAKETLTEILDNDTFEIRTCTSKSEAEKHLMGVPSMVVTDLSVPVNPTGGHPKEKNGMDILRFIVREPHVPPVFINSGSLSSEISQKLLDNNIISDKVKMYDDVVKDIQEIQSGTIYILGQKGFSSFKDSNFATAVRKWIDSEYSKRIRAKSITVELGVTKFRTFKLKDKKFDKSLINYCDENRAELPEEVLFVESITKNMKELKLALYQWFSHTGIIDPTSTVPEPSKSAPISLTDHDAFPTICLIIKCKPSTLKTVGIAMRYWALSRNVLLVRDDVKASETLAYSWRNSPSTDRGPISRLRHDARDFFAVSDLERAVGIITEAESIIFSGTSNIMGTGSSKVKPAILNSDQSKFEKLFSSQSQSDVMQKLRDLLSSNLSCLTTNPKSVHGSVKVRVECLLELLEAGELI